eukprot:5834206-Lingulodinium_polyedra.AAC.1
MLGGSAAAVLSPLGVPHWQFSVVGAVLARVLRQASYQHRALLGRAVIGWRGASQLISAQAHRDAT